MDFIDPQVVVQGYLQGKVEQTMLFILAFNDATKFPHMATNAFMDCATFLDREF
jgi:hypothetical protein